MAVIEVSLLFTGRGGRDTFDKHRTYSRTYEVRTDDPDDDEQVAGAAAGVPRLGDPLDSDPDAVVVGIDCQQSDDDYLLWYVTVDYDSDPPTPDRDRPDQKVDFNGNTIDRTNRPASPLNEPAQWTLTFTDTEEPVIDGIPVDDNGNLVIDPVATSWAAHTTFGRGTRVKSGLNVYTQTAGGVGLTGNSGGPTGTGTAITETPATWATSTAYAIGDFVKNGTAIYECTASGTSAAAGAGPVGDGSGTAITDGTVQWRYTEYVAAVWAFYATYAQTQNDPNFALVSAVLNSAGVPFNPPAMTTVSRVVLSVTANMPIATLEYLLLLKNGLNIIPWRGVPARCAKIRSVTHDGGKQQNGIDYVTTKWEIELDADTFDVRLLDQGFMELKTSIDPGTLELVRKPEKIVDEKGNEITEPVLLNGAGVRLETGEPPVFLRFVPRQCKLIDFNTLLPF